MSGVEYWFRCPDCEAWGTIDEDQADGRVSIDHTPDGCTYHKTVRVRPRIPATETIRTDAVLTIEDVS